MASIVSLFCALALFVQMIKCQGIGNSLNGGLNFNGFGANFANGCAGSGLAGSAMAGYGPKTASGGGFAVTSASPIAPTGVSVLAENLAIEGPLSVGGQLPFLGTVGIEGTLPAIGSGAVSYGCGTGNIGITNEGLGNLGVPGPYGLAGQAYGSGLANSGYGPGYGAGLMGPGLAGPGFGAAGLAGPGYGAGIGGPGFAPGLLGSGFGAGLGYNGVSGVSAGAVLK